MTCFISFTDGCNISLFGYNMVCDNKVDTTHGILYNIYILTNEDVEVIAAIHQKIYIQTNDLKLNSLSGYP